DLEKVEVGDLEARPFQDAPGGGYRTGQLDDGIDPDHCLPGDGGQRRDAEPSGRGFGDQDEARGAIRDLRGVAGAVPAVGPEDRLQGGERLLRRWPEGLVPRELNRAPRFVAGLVDRHHLVAKATGVPRGASVLL